MYKVPKTNKSPEIIRNIIKTLQVTFGQLCVPPAPKRSRYVLEALTKLERDFANNQ